MRDGREYMGKEELDGNTSGCDHLVAKMERRGTGSENGVQEKKAQESKKGNRLANIVHGSN